jgi:hypothetical protein
MEHLRQDSSTPLVILPLRLPVVLVVVAAFAGLNIGLKALVGYTATVVNPFAAFADVFPGQPRSAAFARGFSCASANAHETYQDIPEETCIFRPESEPFFMVQMFLYGDTIRQVDFRMHENTIRVGDLIALWGHPEADAYSRSIFLYWRSQGIFALVPWESGQFSLFLPVRRVYFFDS